MTGHGPREPCRDLIGKLKHSKPSALGGGRSWTAAFESVNPRKDEAYWWVTLTESDGTTVEFFVRIYIFGPVQSDADGENLQA